jgi:hypothetical protein
MTVYKTKEYRAWIEMKRRCYNPKRQNYKVYGARGITVCDRWLHDFSAFLSDVGYAPSSLHSLDRVDPDGHYEPGNVRWATPDTQNNNRRVHRTATVQGITKTAAEWARETGLHPATIRHRLRSGIDGTIATSKPSRGWRREVTINGETHTAKEWSRILGIPLSTLNYRLRNNKPIIRND